MKYFIFICMHIVLFGFNTAQGNDQPSNFFSNGCTSSPDGTWGHCCYEHDYLYWLGGGFADRKAADKGLLQCMNESNGPGYLYYGVVRSSGADLWANAWENYNRKTNLSYGEIQAIVNEEKLWASIGYPANFDFIVTESIMFLDLSDSQKLAARQVTDEVKQRSDYHEFLSAYISWTGRLPKTEKH